MSSIAIITARGGSKRIPKKNIKLFCGYPIISYSIKAAIESCVFDTVMVSTDSKEIADIALSFGASVPFLRSEATSNDYATTREVLLEVLYEYKKRGAVFDEMTCIYPTAPFITPEKLRMALGILRKDKGSLLIPVVKYSYPPQRAYIIKDNELVFKWEENRNKRTQDLDDMYHDAGQFYCYNVNDFLSQEGAINKKVIPFVIPETEAQDIDTEQDWLIAELKYKAMRGIASE